MSKTSDRMEKIFKDLESLMKTREFTWFEIKFMRAFLERALEMTNGVTKKAEAEEKEKSDR